VRWLNASGRLEHNALLDNGEYALINDGSGAVDAGGNWWGDEDPAMIATAIRDGNDRSGLGLVKAEDALQQPLSWVAPVTP
jgi:hypothetical protein